MYDLSKHITLRNCQRSFDQETPVDSETIEILTNTANDFVEENNLNISKFFITNKHEIKIIHSSALIDNEPAHLAWKTNTQVLAPLLFLSYQNSLKDSMSIAQIGRLYAKLGLIAIERGYQTGFCLCINTKVLEDWDITKKYVKTDPETGIHLFPIFLSIGKPLDKTKPYNWSAMYNKYNPSHVRRIFANIQIKK